MAMANPEYACLFNDDEVHLLGMKDPQTLYVNPVLTNWKFMEMQEALGFWAHTNVIYKRDGGMRERKAEVAEMVVAEREPSVWMRAIVEAVKSDGYDLFFMDWAVNKFVPFSGIQRLQQYYTSGYDPRNMPWNAVPVKLVDFHPLKMADKFLANYIKHMAEKKLILEVGHVENDCVDLFLRPQLNETLAVRESFVEVLRILFSGLTSNHYTFSMTQNSSLYHDDLYYVNVKPEAGKKIKFVCSMFLMDDAVFMCHLETFHKNQEEMEGLIREWVSHPGVNKNFNPRTTNEICLASVDGSTYYRAAVCEVLPGQPHLLQLLDYGKMVVLGPDRIRRYPNNLTLYACPTVMCKIDGVHEGNWMEAERILKNRVVDCEILQQISREGGEYRVKIHGLEQMLKAGQVGKNVDGEEDIDVFKHFSGVSSDITQWEMKRQELMNAEMEQVKKKSQMPEIIKKMSMAAEQRRKDQLNNRRWGARNTPKF